MRLTFADVVTVDLLDLDVGEGRAVEQLANVVSQRTGRAQSIPRM
jgi:hypothetical protein